jgi:lycopene beta-cyclase
MDPPLPVAGQRVLATGAAASSVHPATGYLVAAALRAAPRVAGAVARGLDAPAGGPARAAELGWEAVWPADRVRRHRLQAFGLEALLGMDPPATARFFRAFFALPPADWASYLSGTRSSAATAAAMTRLYAAATPDLRRALRRAALGPHRAALLASTSGRLPAHPGPLRSGG